MVLTTCTFISKYDLRLVSSLLTLLDQNDIYHLIINSYGSNITVSFNFDNKKDINLTELIRGQQMIRENLLDENQKDVNFIKISLNLINDSNIFTTILNIINDKDYKLKFLEFNKKLNNYVEIKINANSVSSIPDLKKSFEILTNKDIFFNVM